jgi:hypothetical protein
MSKREPGRRLGADSAAWNGTLQSMEDGELLEMLKIGAVAQNQSMRELRLPNEPRGPCPNIGWKPCKADPRKETEVGWVMGLNRREAMPDASSLLQIRWVGRFRGASFPKRAVRVLL